MKEISNPFASIPDYRCFGCSPLNPEGLRMKFYEDGDDIVSLWEIRPEFAGYVNVMHGGVQSTLIDETASWVVFVKLGTMGYTRKLTVEFRKTVNMDKSPLELRATLTGMKENIALIDVKLRNSQKELCSEASAEFFTLPAHIAQKRLKFPSKEAFYQFH
jgi:acyl-coenzyme A thioesterase PaaI-like protein